MNCEQKSGVFLNESCKNSFAHTCDNCRKQICHEHYHKIESHDLCEDCYWEKYLYLEDEEQIDDVVFDDTTRSTFTVSSSSTSTSSSEQEGGFKEGFGGGEFGGGGAAGAWTEGDAQGFNETDGAGGLLDNDDTFYYS